MRVVITFASNPYLEQVAQSGAINIEDCLDKHNEILMIVNQRKFSLKSL